MYAKDFGNQRSWFDLSLPVQTARLRYVCRKAAWEKFVLPFTLLWVVNGLFSALHFHLFVWAGWRKAWKNHDFWLGWPKYGFIEVYRE